MRFEASVADPFVRIAVVVALVVGLAGCEDDGRSVRDIASNEGVGTGGARADAVAAADLAGYRRDALERIDSTIAAAERNDVAAAREAWAAIAPATMAYPELQAAIDRSSFFDDDAAPAAADQLVTDLRSLRALVDASTFTASHVATGLVAVVDALAEEPSAITVAEELSGAERAFDVLVPALAVSNAQLVALIEDQFDDAEALATSAAAHQESLGALQSALDELDQRISLVPTALGVN